MRRSKAVSRRTKGLGETAGEYLAATLGPLEEQFEGELQQLGELSVIFTWNGKDYRVHLSPYTEAAKVTRKSRKNIKVAGT